MSINSTEQTIVITSSIAARYLSRMMHTRVERSWDFIDMTRPHAECENWSSLHRSTNLLDASEIRWQPIDGLADENLNLFC